MLPPAATLTHHRSNHNGRIGFIGNLNRINVVHTSSKNELSCVFFMMIND